MTSDLLKALTELIPRMPTIMEHAIEAIHERDELRVKLNDLEAANRTAQRWIHHWRALAETAEKRNREWESVYAIILSDIMDRRLQSERYPTSYDIKQAFIKLESRMVELDPRNRKPAQREKIGQEMG